ncbi:hypothetical protein [Sphingomonas sp.]|jgi:hypothetical protein|uniref:hypothetical protein n=1 Tax=Sphingomonas sp. TaxID=28214 RepID=UPI000DBBC36E|nr:hypothetical protein [Sphingomonas sp.]PZT91643.1 MAG: hypothetical protein DI625_15060 [Sphingomonas sp.]
MTTTRTIRLTCDRCGAEVTHDDAQGHRPRDWEGFALSNAERGIQLTGDLCPSCAMHMADALRHPDAAPLAPPAPKRLGLTLEDYRIIVADADATIRDAITSAVAEFRVSPTKMLDPDAFADVLANAGVHAQALIDRMRARLKELPHG